MSLALEAPGKSIGTSTGDSTELLTRADLERGSISPTKRLALRTAFEALRAGVPNRVAVRLLGSVEDAIEDRFEASLGTVWTAAPPPLIFAGGFGTGKSHLLGFLREVALRRNFVVSTVTISKKTPLSAPLEVFAAALRHTIVPGTPTMS